MRPHLTLVDPKSAAPGAADAFRTWSGYVAALAFRLLGREAEVDDVVQDVFLIALDGFIDPPDLLPIDLSTQLPRQNALNRCP